MAIRVSYTLSVPGVRTMFVRGQMPTLLEREPLLNTWTNYRARLRLPGKKHAVIHAFGVGEVH